MQLVWIIICLFFGGAVAAIVGQYQPRLSRWAALFTLVVASFLTYGLLNSQPIDRALMDIPATAGEGVWVSYIELQWIPRFGITFLLAADGISVVLIALTLFLGFVALLSAWNEIHQACGFFYFNFLWVLAGVVGIFTALDLFLFFVFWEVMLIPMFFIIIIWGHEARYFAGIKFFIYTQASSLLLLISMVALVFINAQQTGDMSFSWFTLLGTHLDSGTGLLLMLGFFIAFLVKLPGVPLHNWLPDAHTQAPTPGSVILAGILLKTGAYGLLRFIIPLFPEATAVFTPYAMALAVISILYAAKLAFAQNDMKRMIAYSSISHMGFVTLGIFSWNAMSLQGTLLQMIAHGLSSAGLFCMAGAIQHRFHTRALDNMGGMWAQFPKMAAITLFFAVAALGLPGLGNFVGEFLVLLGSFQQYPVASVLAALAMVAAPVYALRLLQKSFFGEQSQFLAKSKTQVLDFDGRELTMMAVLIAGLLIMGFFPRLISVYTNDALQALQALSGRS